MPKATSEDLPVPGIYAKMFELQKLAKGVQKDATNPHFRYKFASAEGVNEYIKPLLQQLGILAVPRTTMEFSDGKMVVARTEIDFIDPTDGSIVMVSGLGEGSENKQAMKATTSSLKYALLAAGLAPMTDNPEADASEDRKGLAAVTVAASTKSNRVVGVGAGNGNGSPKPVAVGEDFVTTILVDKVYDGRVSERTGKTGPGTVVATDGNKYDTFDTDLLDIARGAVGTDVKLNVMYRYDEKWKKNTIVEDGLSQYGVEAQAFEAGA